MLIVELYPLKLFVALLEFLVLLFWNSDRRWHRLCKGMRVYIVNGEKDEGITDYFQ